MEVRYDGEAMPATKFVTAVCLCGLLLAPTSTHAAPASDTIRSKIDALLAQIEELQALLTAATAASEASVPRRPLYESTIFPVEPEAAYRIRTGQLVRIDRDLPVRAGDADIFHLFADVLGTSAVERYVDEWRIFYEESLDLGGFVEQRADTGEWIVGINRAEFDSDDPAERASFAELFIHEYAHLLVADLPEQLDEFTDRFWRARDHAHSERVAQLSGEQRFDALLTYYDRHEDRFVSDYATLNPDEDFAESFLAFILTDRPSSGTIAEAKVRFFYRSADWQLERARLRANLNRLGLLE